MRIVRDFPHQVRDIENCWIPMPDGCRLAARLWLPAGAREQPVPAILEYIPYRKRDFTRARDEPIHRYFAGHGYAAVRLDTRGTGDSEGLLEDEYSEQELDDGVAAIGWIAAQPWCSGAVGMIGKSWGGFNALQVAARRPDALRAVITVCSTDDRYADDAHYMGGCLLTENLAWGTTLLHFTAKPPDPAIVGERWRAMWLARLEHAVPFPEPWLRHQRRDDYWKRGSVCEDFSRIQCPVYAVGGWADAYTNAVPRLLAGLHVPRKGLVGPWAHVYPHNGVPGPAIGFLQEARRWWDHWLRGQDTGIMDEPAYRVWMQESVPPRTSYPTRPGRWVAEATWPSPRITMRRYTLNAGGLDAEPAAPAPRPLHSPQTVGLAGGDWCGFGADGEAPADQGDDDAGSLVFDSPPLTEPLEILGAPVAIIELAADHPRGLLAVRLSDLAEDGSATRVTYGLLNLTHRSGHQAPAPLAPGRVERVRVQLNDAAYAFPAGHRLRVALSTSYWPIAWPAPDRVTLTIVTGRSVLDLPVRVPRAEDAALRPFDAPESAAPPERTELESATHRRTVERDATTGETTSTIISAGIGFGGTGTTRIHAIDLEIGHRVAKRFGIHHADPLSAWAEVEQETTLARETWRTRVETRSRLSAGRDALCLKVQLRAWEDGRQVFERRWVVVVPRELV